MKQSKPVGNDFFDRWFWLRNEDSDILAKLDAIKDAIGEPNVINNVLPAVPDTEIADTLSTGFAELKGVVERSTDRLIAALPKKAVPTIVKVLPLAPSTMVNPITVPSSVSNIKTFSSYVNKPVDWSVINVANSARSTSTTVSPTTVGDTNVIQSNITRYLNDLRQFSDVLRNQVLNTVVDTKRSMVDTKNMVTKNVLVRNMLNTSLNRMSDVQNIMGSTNTSNQSIGNASYNARISPVQNVRLLNNRATNTNMFTRNTLVHPSTAYNKSIRESVLSAQKIRTVTSNNRERLYRERITKAGQTNTVNNASTTRPIYIPVQQQQTGDKGQPDTGPGLLDTAAAAATGYLATKAKSVYDGAKSFLGFGAKEAVNVVNVVPSSVVGRALDVAQTVKPTNIARPIESVAVAEKVIKPAAEVAEKAVSPALKEAVKQAVKSSALRMIGKAIPVVGLAAGGYFAYERLMKGDVKGAGLELASGLLSTVPGAGTAASIAIDLGLLASDLVDNKVFPSPEIAMQYLKSNPDIINEARTEAQTIIDRRGDTVVNGTVVNPTNMTTDTATTADNTKINNVSTVNPTDIRTRYETNNTPLLSVRPPVTQQTAKAQQEPDLNELFNQLFMRIERLLANNQQQQSVVVPSTGRFDGRQISLDTVPIHIPDIGLMLLNNGVI